MLIVARTAGSPPFADSVTPLVSAFADQAAVALDKAARQRLARQLDVYEDRDRIARDLHDLVIQRVFAAGLALQAVLPRVGDAEARRRIQGVVGQLDDTVRDIRTTIFDLHTTDSAGRAAACAGGSSTSYTETAGESIKPTVRMSGAVDSLVTGELAADVEAVVREAVSNVARHSGATHVTVTLDVADEVVVEVVDDGRGIDERGGPQRPAQPRAAGPPSAAVIGRRSAAPTAAPGCAGRAAALIDVRRVSSDGGGAPQLGGQDRGLGPPFQAELGQQVRHVVLDRLLGEEHPLADLPVGQPLPDELEHGALLLAQLGERAGRLGRAPHALQHRGGGRRVQQRAPAATVRTAPTRSCPRICLSR